jgi:hypothetical protein
MFEDVTRFLSRISDTAAIDAAIEWQLTESDLRTTDGDFDTYTTRFNAPMMMENYARLNREVLSR